MTPRPTVFARSSTYIKAEALEYKSAGKEIWHFTRTHNWKATAKNVVQRKYWVWWALVAFTIITSTLLSHYHSEIISAIGPYKAVVRKAPAVWLIPIIVLIIVSFPPLFGHELIILVCGVIYSIPVAFAIACAGTFGGEIACFYAARTLLSKRARKIETKSITYACLARMMREGGVKASILVRFSAVPSHITTAIQSTIGIPLWVYSVAAVVSLPKQFALVYLGYVYGQSSEPIEVWRLRHPEESDTHYYSADATATQRRNISFIVFAATFFATLIAFVFIWMKIRQIRPSVIAAMEAYRLEVEARKVKGSDEEPEMDGIELDDADAKTGFSSSTTVPVGLDHRPSFVHRDSSSVGTFSSQKGLLAKTSASSNVLGQYSPSMPHLPLDRESEEEDYFARISSIDSQLPARRKSLH